MCKIKKEESTILEIEDGSFWYDGEVLPVWEHLFAKFYAGKIHGIVGPSGCGKSSVLCYLNGLIPYMIEGKAQGSVFFQGKNITKERPSERCKNIGFVMQHPESQFCTFTVEEELAFGMENLGYSKEIMSEKMQEILEQVNMTGFEQVDLNHLSGGQKQKIAIASILVMDPEIILLDEPTANLDPVSRKEIFQLICDLSHRKNKTVILVEHNIGEIIQEIDVIYQMDQSGKIERIQEWVSPYARKDLCYRNVSKAKSDETILELKHLSFSYEKKKKKKKWDTTGHELVIEDLNLSIPRGDFLAILGKNGAGKTTLLKIIFQICKVQNGQIFFHDKPIHHYKRKEIYRKMGLVFQNPESQFVKNTVYEEMEFSLKKLHLSKEEMNCKIMKMLDRFHLEQMIQKSPFVLSLGQKRRLSVASMLLTNQEILFLDEPTYGQDYENRLELMNDLEMLNQQGVTIVMITHDLSVVKDYASRVAVLENGKISSVQNTEDYFQDK